MMWPALSTMSADLSTAFVAMSLTDSIASLGLKPIGFSSVMTTFDDITLTAPVAVSRRARCARGPR